MEEVPVDVLIITALKVELDAVLALALGGQGEEQWEQRTDRYGFPYYVRKLTNENGDLLHVAAAGSGEMGEASSAARAVALIDELNPACLAMCGICAGKKGDTFLGDIVVADRVYSYDHGKLIASEENGAEFFHDIETYNLDKQWAMIAPDFAEEFQRSWEGRKTRPPSREMQARWLLHALHAHEKKGALSPEKHPDRRSCCPGWKQRLEELREAGLIKKSPGQLALTTEGHGWIAEDTLQHPDGPQSDPEFRVHVGPIATGKTVREDPELFGRLMRHVRKTLGAEMEAAAIGAVAQRLGRRSIIVKSVSDHADHAKDDAYRAFACRASAEFLLAFLRRHMCPSEVGPSFHGVGAGERPTRVNRYEFLERVRKVCMLKWSRPGTAIQARPAPPPFGNILEVSATEDRIHVLFPVAALDQDISEEWLGAFEAGILAPYRRQSPGVRAYLVHVGRSAPDSLDQKARAKHINLYSFEEFQGLIDFSSYVELQTARLRNDHSYLPEHYVEQRAQVLVDGSRQERVEGVLSMIQGLLASPDPRFLLVLGEFGIGKTFLLHELARRMGQEGSALVPVLLEMRALQKALDLRALVAQHFAVSSLRHFSLDSFFYMLREGRIALLFDGFDELALRVTYDQVMEHFGTLAEAAQEKAKVIVTSRTQHFLTDHDVKRELARRAEALPGYRIIKLERFGEEQIRSFLVKRLGSEADAAERLEMLHDVKDLLGLSENPRFLSFIVDLDPGKLAEARGGSGEFNSAKLYELLIEKWLQGEYERVNPKGAPKGLSLQQLRSAATELALLLWETTERTVELHELPKTLIDSLNARAHHALDPDVIRHQLGSGSLLVRDEDGRFSFVHQSVMEWLVAKAAADGLRLGGSTAILDRREMSELMADFVIALTGSDAVRTWARRKAASAGSGFAKKNALRLMGRLGEAAAGQRHAADSKTATNLEGSDLRGQDLSGNDLRGANLRKADLSGATLVRVDLTGAKLQDARLIRADLERALLTDAELQGADLTRARLLGAELRGARLQGARLRAAKLIGAKIDSLDGCDVSGAAMPAPDALVPSLVPNSPSCAVAFSPADDLIATGYASGVVCLWDAATGMALRLLEHHKAHVRSVAFSPNGAILASASDEGTVALWSVARGERLSLLEGHKASVLSVAFSPDGTTLASASDDWTVALWSVSRGVRLRVWGGHKASVLSVAFSPDGVTFASASDDWTIILWNLTNGESLRLLEGHQAPVLSVAFSPDGAMLASASDDGTLILWSVARGERLRKWEGHRAAVWSVAFSPDGAMLASASNDWTAALWNVARGRRVHLLVGHQGFVRSVAFSPDGATLVSASDDRTAAFWSVTRGERLRVLKGHQPPVWRAAFSPDGATLASASEDGTIALWSVLQGERLRLLKAHDTHVWSIAFSPDGATLASASDDETIALWSVARGELVRLLTGHTASVRSIAFSPDGATLASASEDGTVALWSVAKGKDLLVLEGHHAPVFSVAFSPDGLMLASASEDGTVALWSIAKGKRLLLLEGPKVSAWSVAFSPDGTTLASASDNRTVTLWSVARGERLHLLEGHRAPVFSVAFSPDGATLASASDDGTVCLWDVSTGRLLATLLGLPGGWAAFRPDGRYKFHGSLGGAFWHASGLCRFEVGELDTYLSLRIPDGEPILKSAQHTG